MKNTILLILISGNLASAQLKYPQSKMIDVTDTYFGVTYHDPYRWLENMKDTTVSGWFKDQAALTNNVMSTLNGRDELITEWRKLDKLQPARISARVYENGRLFYRKTMPGEKIGKLYYREGATGAEQLLFDPSVYVKGKDLTIEGFVPSHDAKNIAIAYSETGAEVSTVKIMNVDSKKFLPDEMYPSDGVGGWTFDDKAVLYGWIKSADNADPEQRLNPKQKLHTVGTPTQNDVDFFSNATYPELKIEPKNYPYVFLTDDNRNYVFAGQGSVKPEMQMYYAPIGQFYSGKIQWKELARPSDKLVRSFEIMGEKVFALTYADAKNYKLLSVDLSNPDWSKATVVVPERKDRTLESITRSKDYLLITHSDGINNYLSKYNPSTGKTTDIKLPYSGQLGVFCLDKKTNIVTVNISSWTKPPTEFDLDGDTEKFTPGKLNPPPVYPSEYLSLEVKEVEVKGHDGTMIPMSIVYRKGIKLDGNNVCLMDSYGAYGISMSPWFSVRENTLATKGVVIAYPHVRGGSEKGEEWYRAGYKTTKPNTWKDFISCAEYLIANGYTKSSKLAGTGTSAGGVLISRTITERPDLFAAAICNVGCANAMRLEFSSNGPVNIPEFGTVTDSVEVRALYEMDGMQHVVKGTKYPAMMSVAGWNDSRVIAWQPGKLAAAMQNASTSGKPVLMKVNYDNGHFTQDKEVTWANFADQFAFVMWQTGHPDFQPKKVSGGKVDTKK